MQAQTTAQPHYRRTKSGQWVIQAPVAQIHAGERITVHKRDGSVKTEMIEKVGKAFEIDGIQQAYGYIAERPRYVSSSCGRRSVPRYERCRACGGDGSVERELGECAVCHRDCDC